MKDYKSLSDSELLKNIRIDAENERRSGLAVIHQLREIAFRRLDARRGHKSLHRFCMDELKYSSGSAWRRIKAMEALEDLPELEPRMEAGELTLANVSQVQEFRIQNTKSVEEKRAILDEVTGLSKREVERKLARIAPMPERPEKVRAISAEKTELRVNLDAETMAALDRVRDLIQHAHPGASYADIIAYLARMGAEKLDPAREPSRKIPPGENTQAIPAAARREVWRRDQGQCTYQDPATGRKCGASALLQLDHIVPRAQGRGNETSNLRLRCRRHNLLAAIDALGSEKMRTFLIRTRY
jgi:hypothetical protein